MPFRTREPWRFQWLILPAFTVLSLWPAWSTPAARRPPWPQRRRTALAAAAVLVLLALALLLLTLTGSAAFGLWERLLLAAQSGWLALVALAGWWDAGRPVDPVRAAAPGRGRRPTMRRLTRPQQRPPTRPSLR